MQLGQRIFIAGILLAFSSGCVTDLEEIDCSKTPDLGICKSEDDKAKEGEPKLFVDPPFGVGFSCVLLECDEQKGLLVENKGGGYLALSEIFVVSEQETDFSLQFYQLDENEERTEIAKPAKAEPLTLINNQKLFIVVSYQPSDAIEDIAKLRIRWYDGNQEYDNSVIVDTDFDLTARFQAVAKAEVLTNALNFPYTEPTSTHTAYVEIKNISTKDTILGVNQIQLSENSADTLSIDLGWRGYANPGETIKVPVIFSPTSEQVAEGNLSITLNDRQEPYDIPIKATSITGGRLTLLTPFLPELDFGNLFFNASKTLSLEVQNQGSESIQVTSTVTNGTDYFHVIPQEDFVLGTLEKKVVEVTVIGALGGTLSGNITLSASELSENTTNANGDETTNGATCGDSNPPMENDAAGDPESENPDDLRGCGESPLEPDQEPETPTDQNSTAGSQETPTEQASTGLDEDTASADETLNPTDIEITLTASCEAPVVTTNQDHMYFTPQVLGWLAEAQSFKLFNTGTGHLVISKIEFELGSSHQIELVNSRQLPISITPGDEPMELAVRLRAGLLGSANATLLVTTNAIDHPLVRLQVEASVVTCQEGCPVVHGTPNCFSGSCQIENCDDGYHDLDAASTTGCECAEERNGHDIGSLCGTHLEIQPLYDQSDKKNSHKAVGTLHHQDDVDLFFVETRDEFNWWSDDYDARVSLLEAPAGMVLCAKIYAQSGLGCTDNDVFYDNHCKGVGGTIRAEGSSFSTDNHYIKAWIMWSPGSAPVCSNYEVKFQAK
ncbi:MAG: choice-of-anchor D domain-containing protein [Myxococcota bacterium]|nr:choice-of-anchor D domain-containing protein [Myxococcota bacterium]